MKAVSLFSGCGGLDLGLVRAGFDVVFASDIDPHCAASYELNFPGTPFYEGRAGELTRALLAKVSKGEALDHVDLLAGGPPCPPFSKSRFYRTEKPRALEDAVGEETINAYLTVLAAVRPSAFILENVAGLAYKVHESALDLIIGTAEDLGYAISSKVINAADYGVPQMRERFFVVGMLDSTFEFPEPTHAKEPGGSPENAARLPWATAGEAINDLDTEENADDTGHFAGGKYHHLLKEIPPGDNYLFLTAKRGHPNPQFEWRKRYLVVSPQAEPKVAFVDDPGPSLEQHGSAPLAQPNPSDRGGHATADLPRRLASDRNDRASMATDRQRGTASPRGDIGTGTAIATLGSRAL